MLFREAYSSLQLAFEGELVESQRRLGVEMMASMAQEFMMRMMASDLESHYWQMVLTEQNPGSSTTRSKKTQAAAQFLVSSGGRDCACGVPAAGRCGSRQENQPDRAAYRVCQGPQRAGQNWEF